MACCSWGVITSCCDIFSCWRISIAMEFLPRKNHISETEIVSQIHCPGLAAGGYFVGCAVFQHFAVAQNIGLITDSQCLAHIVVGNEHPDIPLLQRNDKVLDISHRNGVYARKWLIKQDK